MGSASGNGMSLKGNNSRNARKVICLVVSAVALLTILAPVLTADVSSADTDTSSEFTIKFVNQRGAEITTPLFTDSVLPFDTENTENGLIYSLHAGIQIDSIPAYFVIQSKQKLDGNLFKAWIISLLKKSSSRSI